MSAFIGGKSILKKSAKSGLEGGQCICQGLLLPSVYVEKLTKTSDW